MEKNKEFEECQKKCNEYLEGWKRERADFLNYKKEEMERIEGIIKYCNEETILKILPILDNFYIAEREMGDDLKNHKWSEGFLNIKQQILEFLKSQNIEEIKTIGDPPSPKASARQGKFDPNFMEAVEEVKIEDVESGTIMEEIQKGYTMNGKVIRPAKVKVSK